MHSNNNLVWFSLSAFRYSNSNIEKWKAKKKKFFFDIRHPDEYRKAKVKKKWHSTICWILKNDSQKIFDIRHHDECRKTKVKKKLTFAIMRNIEKGKSKFLSFFDIHHDGECQNFFFAFRFSIFEFEFRKWKKENQTKLLLVCTCILNRKIHY